MAHGGFGQWVARRRRQRGKSQAQLARDVGRLLSRDFVREQVWRLEHGVPENPSPELVMAIAKALNRPLPEALAALGYELPREVEGLEAELASYLHDLPVTVQVQLPHVISTIIDLARSLQLEPDAYSTAKPELQRVAER